MSSPTSNKLRQGNLARVSVSAVGSRLTIVRDPLRVLLFLLTVLTVSRVHQHYPILMKLRPALLLVVAAAGYAYLNPRYLSRQNVLDFWPMKVIVLLGVLACCSAAFGISLGRTAHFILDIYIKVLAYAFLLVVSIRHVRDLFTFVWGYVVGCGILAFFSLFVFGITKSSINDFARLDHLYTYDANDLGVIMMLGLAFTLLLLVSARGIRRIALLVILLGIAATIARSGSRGGFLGFLAVSTASLFLVNSVGAPKKVLILGVAGVALSLGAPAGYWKQMGTVMAPKDDYNYSTIDGRKALAERGIGYMVKYPVFGLGMNNFSRAECTISPKLEGLQRDGPIRCTAPHNSYIQAGSELGVPGLLLWVSLVAGVIVSLLRLRGKLPRAWRRGTEVERFLYGATSFFPLAMIGFAVTAFFVSFAWMEPLYTLAAFTTGLFVVIPEYISERSLGLAGAPSVQRRTLARSAGWRVAQSAHRLKTSAASTVAAL
jgi:O-antigen ligase